MNFRILRFFIKVNLTTPVTRNLINHPIIFFSTVERNYYRASATIYRSLPATQLVTPQEETLTESPIALNLPTEIIPDEPETDVPTENVIVYPRTELIGEESSDTGRTSFTLPLNMVHDCNGRSNSPLLVTPIVNLPNSGYSEVDKSFKSETTGDQIRI